MTKKNEYFQNYAIDPKSKKSKFQIQPTKTPKTPLYISVYIFSLYFSIIFYNTRLYFSSYKNYFQDDRKKIYLTRVLKTPIIEVDFTTNFKKKGESE